MDVRLEEIKEEHLEMIRQWRNQPNVQQHTLAEKDITPEEQRKWFSKMKEDPKSEYWLISYKDEWVGVGSLKKMNFQISNCHLSLYIADDELHGKGIGAMTQYLLIERAFNHYKFHKVRTTVFLHSKKTISQQEGLGFRRESYYRDYMEKNGQWFDAAGFAIIDWEWKMHKPFFEKLFYRHSEKPTPK